MNEIKCPNCGEVFEIDELSYEKIASQVRDKEFEKRIKEKEEKWEDECLTKEGRPQKTKGGLVKEEGFPKSDNKE